MLRRLIGEHIEMVILPGADLEPVKVDPGQMEQVLMNMAVNARDAMPQGGRLVIETANVALGESETLQHTDIAPGKYVMLRITDTGAGITREVKDHIFEPFFTTKGVGEGTGLGLSTCYGIVTQNGGFIDVDSELGQGACFKIFLPATDESSNAVLKDDREDDLPRGAETVLLAEDDSTVRAMVTEILQEKGYRVLEAANGDEALRVAQAQTEGIDILVTDVVMPNVGGPELSKRLRTAHPDVKVLFTSGYTEGVMFHFDDLPPGADFLRKPFMPDAMAVKVREVLDG